MPVDICGWNKGLCSECGCDDHDDKCPVTPDTCAPPKPVRPKLIKKEFEADNVEKCARSRDMVCCGT